MDDATLQSKTNALRQRHNINNARYRERNAIRIAEEARKRKKASRDAINAYQRDYRWRKKMGLPLKGIQRPGIDFDRQKATKKLWLAKNAEAEAVRHRNRYNADKQRFFEATYRHRKRNQGTGNQTDMAFRMRSRLKNALKNAAKTKKSQELLGCTWAEYAEHLGKTDSTQEMHIDHIWPIRCYDLTDPKEQKRCFNYKNTRYISATENLQKSGNVPSLALAATVPFHLWPKRWKVLGGEEYEDV